MKPGATTRPAASIVRAPAEAATRPVTTIRRGEVVFDAGKITGLAGSGELVRRERWRA